MSKSITFRGPREGDTEAHHTSVYWRYVLFTWIGPDDWKMASKPATYDEFSAMFDRFLKGEVNIKLLPVEPNVE